MWIITKMFSRTATPEEVRDEPAVAQREPGRDAEALADQPGHAGEDEVAEEEADHHQRRPEHDVEEQAPALDCATVQPVAADGHVGEHPERNGDHGLADEDDPAADASHPQHPGDHGQNVGDDDARDHQGEQADEDRGCKEGHDGVAGDGGGRRAPVAGQEVQDRDPVEAVVEDEQRGGAEADQGGVDQRLTDAIRPPNGSVQICEVGVGSW